MLTCPGEALLCVEGGALPHPRRTDRRAENYVNAANNKKMGYVRAVPFARGILYNQLHAGMFGMRSAAGCGARSLTHRITLCARGRAVTWYCLLPCWSGRFEGD